MKPTILPIALAVMIAAGMCGCDNPATVAKKSRNELREYQEARSERDYERAIALIKRANDQTFQAIDEAKQWKALAESLPLVVTNVVTVTNECKYCTWARERVGPWPTNHLRTPFTLELQDQTGGTHRISFPTNWFSTPIPVLYGRVRVSTNAGGVERGE